MPSGRQWCAFARHIAILTVSTGALWAQDPFEIHVLEYEQLTSGEFAFENHVNYVARSAVATTRDVLHDTYELTVGITHTFSFGVMQLNARQPGSPLESAGWRLVPHLYIPRSWHWPIDIGLVTEFAFERPAWNPDSRSVTILPILEKRFGRIQIDVNPTFEKFLRGPDSGGGWNSGLAARIALPGKSRFTPSLEYYADWGPVPAFEPLILQGHQLIPGGDIQIRRNVIWSVGLGVGLTPATDRIVYKSRLEITFGGGGSHH
jgi:hypothetical protein